MTFDEFDLDPRCLRVLETQSIQTPTPIQAQAIPPALEGRDLIATAQTGTGKTLGFALPSLSLLAQEKNKRNRMLVLTPTRELCVQVEAVIGDLAKALKLRSALIYGGVNMQGQTNKLKRGCDIIVATPGRLLDHMGRGYLRFNDLEILIFDEADRMLDMGFLPDIERIVSRLPKKRQTMMFSATFADEIERLARRMMDDPERIAAGAIAKPVDSVRQLLYPVREEEKSGLLIRLLKEMDIDSALIFMRTKARTDRVGRMLKKAGYNAASIHGDLSQRLRQKSLQGFRDGTYKILVATDVAARGLDIEDISHVINYDIPPTADDYVHRVGRTARAEREGDAITFVTPVDFGSLGAIEKAVGHHLPREDYEGAPKILSVWNPKPSKRSSGRKGFFRRRR
jgi:ATP-dependent RNA helicase RhlE